MPSTFKTLLMTVLLIPLLWLQPVYAGDQCSDFIRSQSYFQQVIETRGARLFVKESEPSTAEKRWGGVIRHRPHAELESSWKMTKYLRYMIRTLPLKVLRIDPTGDYELTPLRALYEQTVVRSSNWLSEKLTGQKLEPAFFTRVPLAIAMSMVMWGHVDAYYSQQLGNNITQNIQKYSSTYDTLIESDFRYRHIKADLAKGTINHDVALKRAYWEELSLANYFKYRDENKVEESTLEEEMKLIDHHVFQHLKKIVTEGVKPLPGYLVPESALGPLKDTQKLQLFKLNHVLNLRYQLISESLRKTAAYESVKNDPEVRTLLTLSFETDFAKQLFAFHANGQLSHSQLIYYLQEDAYWQTRFGEWATVGVIKLAKVGDEYTNTPLTLQNIRDEILADIAAKPK